MRPAFLYALVLLLLDAASPLACAPRYSIVDLNVAVTADADFIDVSDMNSLGQVVGTGPSGAWLYDNGVFSTLPVPEGSASNAQAINDSGVVVGAWAPPTSGTYDWAPCMWADGAISHPWGTSGVATAITNSGAVGGWDDAPWMSDIGRTFFRSYYGQCVGGVDDITENGLVVCHDGNGRAYVIRGGSMEYLTPLYGMTAANAANESGVVVGISGTFTTGHAVAWVDGIPHDLGGLPGNLSDALDINESGVIVGSSVAPSWESNGALLWSDNVMYELTNLIPGDSGWTLISANAINDSGQIAGTGIHNGRNAAFVLTPVPEPAGLLAFVAGLAGLPLVLRIKTRR